MPQRSCGTPDEQVIAELKNGPLAHLPSGVFTANAAWLVCAAIAHNLTRAAGALAGGRHRRTRTATIRAQLIATPAPGPLRPSAGPAPTPRLALGTRPGRAVPPRPARPPPHSRLTTAPGPDRAGLGWSDPGPGPRDAARITSELHTLLGNAGVPGPYVMVGHSFGGLYTQLYAARYAEQVAGVVLVESSHPQQFTRLPDGPRNYEQARRLYTVAPVLARLGVVRLFDLSAPPPGLPPGQRAQIEAWAGSTRHVATTAQEFRATPDTMAQVGAVRGLGDLPLAVVSAGEQDPNWLALQNDLAALSTNSSHHVVDEATHTSVVDDLGHARVTSAAIVEVVDAVRTDRPLARAIAPRAVDIRRHSAQEGSS